MTAHRCHICGKVFAEGALSYQVDIHVHSMFDGVIPQTDGTDHTDDLDTILASLSALSEEEITRQVYEHEVFVMCPACKEAFLDELYAKLHPSASPEAGRAHLIN